MVVFLGLTSANIMGRSGRTLRQGAVRVQKKAWTRKLYMVGEKHIAEDKEGILLREKQKVNHQYFSI
jgi:hypothetical protein